MTSERRTVRVDLGERGYDIVIGERLLETAGDVLAPIVAGRRAVVVTDAVIRDAHLPRLAAVLDRLCDRWDTVTVPAGEGAKSFRELEALLHRLLDLGIDRSTVLVAFGGGAVGDVAGFAAALFMRGIDLVQIPTTLMSQVDSAVGGKNAINTPHGKNLVGTFHQPRIVLDDVSVLESLPRRELLSGYGEVVKCGLIRGEAEFAWLEENAPSLLALDVGPLIEAVRMGCGTKAGIVASDERDRGDRALVNLGHTFAHALEAEAGYGALLHGEAVAAGLAAAAALSGEARPLRPPRRRARAQPPARRASPRPGRGAGVGPALGSARPPHPHGARQEDRRRPRPLRSSSRDRIALRGWDRARPGGARRARRRMPARMTVFRSSPHGASTRARDVEATPKFTEGCDDILAHGPRRAAPRASTSRSRTART